MNELTEWKRSVWDLSRSLTETNEVLSERIEDLDHEMSDKMLGHVRKIQEILKMLWEAHGETHRALGLMRLEVDLLMELPVLMAEMEDEGGRERIVARVEKFSDEVLAQTQGEDCGKDIQD